MNNLRFALRQLLKNPGFTAVAVLTLALGIGANTVVFSVARTVLFRPLGYDNEDRLMWFQRVNTRTGATENQVSWRDMEDIRTLTQSFEAVATDNSFDMIWKDGDQSRSVPVVQATPDLITVLNLRPTLGRLLVPSDSERGQPVVLISHDLWQTHYQGSPEVLGQTVRLDDTTRQIVGVLPPGLQFPVVRAPSSGSGSIAKAGKKPFWIPMSAPRGEDRTSRGARMFLGVGRLKPGVSEQAARAELATVSAQLAEEFPETNRPWDFGLLSFREQVFGRMLRGVPLLGAAVAGVLLICCVNLANLLLARGVIRQRELSVRLALGAGRWRLVGALLIESLLLGLVGGITGIALAGGGLHVIRTLSASIVPFIHEASLDGTVIGFAAGLSLLTAFVFGLLPALRVSHIEATDSLRSGPRTTGSPQIRTWQQGLLVGQVAVVLVLLTSAGLLLESFRRLLGQDLGYEAKSVVAMDLTVSGSFETNADNCRMYRALRERLAALPGVTAVGTVSSAPLTGKWTFDEKPLVVGNPLPEADRPTVGARFVAFDYFQAMGTPLLEGRFFRDSEMSDDGYGQIVIVNETAATVLFPGRSAIGGRFTVGSNPDRVLEVIGVVQDTRDVRLEEKPQPRFYWQYAFGGAQVVVRSSMPPKAIIPVFQDVARATDSRIVGSDIRTMADIVSGTVAERRFLMTMLAAYAAVALGIAVVGIFGVVAYQVAQRTNEFGIRLALGSSPAGLMRLVLWQAVAWVMAGVGIGLVVSLGTGRLLANQLFDLSPHDPWLLGGVCLLVLGAALAASALPARRAARLDPMVALRNE
jgi:predicted permease